MNLLASHHSLSFLLILGLLMLPACGEPAEEDETSNNANDSDENNSTASNNASDSNNVTNNNTVFNNASVETPCLEKLTREECYDQSEVTGCGWYGVLEWTWDGETCQHQQRGLCILGDERSPGRWLTVWRLKEDNTHQVIQFGDIPQFGDDTWTRCDSSSVAPPPACACEDPDLL